MMGAHVIRAGVSAHLIDLISRGIVTHVAMNEACPIHEYELAKLGAIREYRAIKAFHRRRIWISRPDAKG